MKTRIHLTIVGLGCLLLAGCQTPEERAMSQMERQMRVQMEMMKRMQKDMDEMEKKMQAQSEANK